MNKICIVSSDSLFAGDLAQQILREVPETEILSADSVQNADMLLIDAESGETASCAGQKAEIPVVLFSSEHELSDYADVVIKNRLPFPGFCRPCRTKPFCPKFAARSVLILRNTASIPSKRRLYRPNPAKRQS